MREQPETADVLDCTSHETTESSLSKILGAPIGHLDRLCREFDLEHFYSHEWGPASEFALRLLGSELPNKRRPVYYFHATRVIPKPDLFSRGLLPLPDVRGDIWSSLWTVACRHCSQEEWLGFRADTERGLEPVRTNHGGTKAAERRSGGPYAFLIREVAVHKAVTGGGGWHDYLRLPEIVEDICAAFQDNFGHDLTSDYLAISRPCLVKFKATGRALELATALLYLCHSVHNMELASDLGLTHDAGGCRMASGRIVHVNWDVP